MNRHILTGMFCISIGLIPVSSLIVNSAEQAVQTFAPQVDETSSGRAQSAIIPLDLAALELADFGDVETP